MDDKPTLDFSLADVREILDLPERVEDTNALTMGEWGDVLNEGAWTVRNRIHQAVAAGLMESVKTYRYSTNNCRYPVTAYRLKKRESNVLAKEDKSQGETA